MTGILSYFCNLFGSEFIFEGCVLQVILHEIGGILFIAIYAAKKKWFFWDLNLQGFSFTVLANLICQPTSGASGGKVFEFCRFTKLVLFDTSGASGGDIFRCTTKDIEERRAKGLRSRPLDSGFLYGGMMPDVRTLYVFAVMHFTRFRLVRWRAGGVRFARLRRKAKHRLFAAISLLQALLPPDSCVLHQVRLKS